mmetsp:Transcript_195/g.452  ORF Transcript_195/g.452 Transcript_195/m.452 type:complete len:447 (-) Transcript_195:776-2116(-)
MFGREGTCTPLPVDEQRLFHSIHHVLFDLGNIVANIIHQMHVHIVGRAIEDFREGLARQISDAGAVDPGEVGGARHGSQILLPLIAVNASATELAIIQVNLVPRHGPLHHGQGVSGDLMSQSPRPGVNHDADLSHLPYPHRLRRLRMVYLVHDLYLSVVIPRPQRPQLLQPSLLRPVRDALRVSRLHPPFLLAVILVLPPRVPLLDGPVDAFRQQTIQLLHGAGDVPPCPHSHGDVPEQGLGQPLPHALLPRLVLSEVGPYQSHAAVDVEPHPSGADNCRGIVHVKRRDIPDAKPVPGVHVRHCETRPDDPGEGGDVGGLSEGGDEGGPPSLRLRAAAGVVELLDQQGLQVVVDYDLRADLHVRHEPYFDLAPRARDAFEERQLLLDGALLPLLPLRAAADAGSVFLPRVLFSLLCGRGGRRALGIVVLVLVHVVLSLPLVNHGRI